MADAEIGIFGGSGFYSLLEGAREVPVDTPYGSPSAPATVGEIEGRKVAFIPRHGTRHEYPPHRVPYRANLWAFRELGVTQVIGPCAAGSLRADVKPGQFVVCDQLVDRTAGRADTFYDGPITTHVSFADPYCPVMRAATLEASSELGLDARDGGTVVTIQGPRFATRSESRWYQDAGWEVINMTQYPEAYLARELEMCYVNVSLITDYDVGLEGMPPVTHEEVIRVFTENNDKLRKLLFHLVPRLPHERDCDCSRALSGARIET
ncbi:MAG TPA: S-methyl-5'-thioadenosine phosphorylase [Actinomycetota bacterium]|nr:S-methyl-5'-thioadenosine phosphorylase [Actinomycetota bacterium]